MGYQVNPFTNTLDIAGSSSSGTTVNSVSNSDGTLIISPTTGDVIASLDLTHANTWTGQQIFNTSAALFGVGVRTPTIYPAADSTTAIKINKADNSTNIITIDTTNSRVGLGVAPGSNKLNVLTTGSIPGINITGDDPANAMLKIANSNGRTYAFISGVTGVSNSGFSVRDVTGGFDIFTVGSTGLFGIGTQSPGAQFSVQADFEVKDNSSTRSFYVNGSGNAGIGTTSNTIAARLHLISTTEQFRAGYDTSNYFKITVSSAGAVTIDAVGASAGFLFSDPITNTNAVLTTPNIGVATATSINKMAVTAPATSSTLAVADGKTFTASNTITLTGTDSVSLNVTNTKVGGISFHFGNGTDVITTGEKKSARYQTKRSGTITGWTILSLDDTSGTITVDVWKDTYANYPPTVADTMIPSGTKPFVSGPATKGTGTTLTGWTTTFAAGDVISVNVDAVTLFKDLELCLDIIWD